MEIDGLKIIPCSISKLLLLLTVVITGCGGDLPITYNSYNELAREEILKLDHDGYIIAIEKRPRNEINGPEIKEKHGFDETRFKSFDQLPEVRRSKFISVTTDPKIMLVTHIFKFMGNSEPLYNPYKGREEPDLDYETSYKALDDFARDLQETIATANKPYSHVILLSMGWNNDQAESIWRYNTIINNVKNQSDESFNPLVIGLSWPSVWLGGARFWLVRTVIGHIFSYPNKVNDADEAGFTVANILLNNIILDQKAYFSGTDREFKVVLIGHSMGARLLASAVFGSDLLMNRVRPYNSQVDLFLGLQGAFSANRFVEGQGAEGSPYRDFRNFSTKFVLTSSINDKANPLARFFSFAEHVGGKYGLEQGRQSKQVFCVTTWPLQQGKVTCDQTEPGLDLALNKRVIMLDTESIVKKDSSIGQDGEYVDGHNDILDYDMARLIWFFIEGT